MDSNRVGDIELKKTSTTAGEMVENENVVKSPKKSKKKILLGNPIQSNITSNSTLEESSHGYVKIENSKLSQICHMCYKTTRYRCESKSCKIPLCLSPCFKSHHDTLVKVLSVLKLWL